MTPHIQSRLPCRLTCVGSHVQAPYDSDFSQALVYPWNLEMPAPWDMWHFISSLEVDPSEARQSIYLITKTWQVPQKTLGGEGATGTRTHTDHCILCQLERKSLRVNQKESPKFIEKKEAYPPWKRPLFCSCWIRMFSNLSGLGMKPISQPSFTSLPIHQSLLYFWNAEIKLLSRVTYLSSHSIY